MFAVVVLAVPVSAGAHMTAAQKHQLQKRYYKAAGVVRFIGRHARLTQYNPDPRVKKRWQAAAHYWIGVRRDAWARLHPKPVRRVPWPAWWEAQAACIHSREGAWNDNTGNSYFGGMQFLESTWKNAGGAHYDAFDHPGDQAHHPFTAPIAEQLLRAWIVWRRDGGWFEWGTAGACGLR